MRPIDDSTLGSVECLQWLWSEPCHLKLVPHAYLLNRQSGNSIPEDLIRRSDQLLKSYLRHSMLLGAANDEILNTLTAASIPAIPIKGPVLAKRLYGGPQHRPFVDLDILVQADQIEAASSAIINAGFQDVSRNRRQFHLEFSRRNRAGSSVHLELHRRLIGYAINGDHLAFGLAGSSGFSEWCWSRATPTESHWHMHHTDKLIYLFTLLQPPSCGIFEAKSHAVHNKCPKS